MIVAAFACNAGGCAFAHWSAPDALVEPGAPTFYSVARKERETQEHSWKTGGDYTKTEVRETRFRAIDVATCRTQRTFTAAGQVSALAWDRDADDLWYVDGRAFDAGRGTTVVHSLSGGSVTLPAGDFSPVRGRSKRPLLYSADPGRGVVRLWDVHGRAVVSFETRPFPGGSAFVPILADDSRVVAVLPAGLPDSAELVVIPRVPALDPARASRLRVTRPHLFDGDAWLVEGAIALRAGQEVATFDLRTGAPIRSVAVPANVPVRVVDEKDPAVLYARGTAASDGNQCLSSLELVRLATGARRVVAVPSCVTDFHWLADAEPPIVLLTGSEAGAAVSWAAQLGPRSDRIVRLGSFDGPSGAPGSSLYYVEGPSNARRLMVVDFSAGSPRPATAPLGVIDGLRADPATETLFIKTRTGTLLYRTRTGKFDLCDGE